MVAWWPRTPARRRLSAVLEELDVVEARREGPSPFGQARLPRTDRKDDEPPRELNETCRLAKRESASGRSLDGQRRRWTERSVDTRWGTRAQRRTGARGHHETRTAGAGERGVLSGEAATEARQESGIPRRTGDREEDSADAFDSREDRLDAFVKHAYAQVTEGASAMRSPRGRPTLASPEKRRLEQRERPSIDDGGETPRPDAHS